MGVEGSVGIVIAVLTLVGAIILKLVEKWLERKDPVVRQRDYRAEIGELIARVDSLESEVDKWRGLYYENEEEVSQLRRSMVSAGIVIGPREPRPVGE